MKLTKQEIIQIELFLSRPKLDTPMTTTIIFETEIEALKKLYEYYKEKEKC